MLKRKPSACFKALAFLHRMPLERVAPDTYAAFRISDVCVCVCDDASKLGSESKFLKYRLVPSTILEP